MTWLHACLAWLRSAGAVRCAGYVYKFREGLARNHAGELKSNALFQDHPRCPTMVCACLLRGMTTDFGEGVPTMRHASARIEENKYSAAAPLQI